MSRLIFLDRTERRIRAGVRFIRDLALAGVIGGVVAWALLRWWS